MAPRDSQSQVDLFELERWLNMSRPPEARIVLKAELNSSCLGSKPVVAHPSKLTKCAQEGLTPRDAPLSWIAITSAWVAPAAGSRTHDDERSARGGLHWRWVHANIRALKCTAQMTSTCVLLSEFRSKIERQLGEIKMLMTVFKSAGDEALLASEQQGSKERGSKRPSARLVMQVHIFRPSPF